MVATAIELERESRRLVSVALAAVADAIRAKVTGKAAKTTHPDVAQLPESLRRLAVERTAPLFELFQAHDQQLLACLDDLAAYFSNPAASAWTERELSTHLLRMRLRCIGRNG